MTSSSSLRWTVDGASLQFPDRAGYYRYATETGTHSVKLCIMDWIDMPVVVHVKVVDISVVAQTQIPMVLPVFLQLQYIDKVIDDCCAGPRCAFGVGDSRDPTVGARSSRTRSLTCPLCQ